MATIDPTRQRTLMRAMYDKAVSAAHPATCVPPHLPAVPVNGRIIIVGAGKATAAMAQAAEKFYTANGDMARVTGAVTTRHGYGLPTDLLPIIEAGHPVPDSNSIASAKLAVTLAKTAGPNDLVLCLLSGGASALWSAPVAGVSFSDKAALTKQLLRSGAPIADMNCVRKHLSNIKGGGLTAAAYPAKMLTLAISDVPGDDPDAIGSGPTVGDPTTLADALAVLRKYNITPPPSVMSALNNPNNETLKPGAEALSASTYVMTATPRMSIDAAAELAKQEGYAVTVLGDSLEGEAREVGEAHAKLALEAKSRGQRVAILSGGEFTVTVRGNGSGGPNQEYALGLAITLDGAEGIAALAGDTDGIDGGGGNPDDPAGAIVMPDTISRAHSNNLNPAALLANNDSTAFFRQLGDLLECGPTQTNVNDFRAILILPSPR